MYIVQIFLYDFLIQSKGFALIEMENLVMEELFKNSRS